jgi:hypothetical protein
MADNSRDQAPENRSLARRGDAMQPFPAFPSFRRALVPMRSQDCRYVSDRECGRDPLMQGAILVSAARCDNPISSPEQFRRQFERRLGAKKIADLGER